MATQVQLRRGTTTQNNAFTGAVGELSVDTDLFTLRIHDGASAGGAATLVNTTGAQTLLNKTFSTGSVWNGSAVPMGYGGTGSALTAVAGAVPYSTSSGMGLTLAGTAGQVLVSGGINAPTWVNASTITAGTATNAVTATNISGGSAGQLLIQSDTDLTTFITAGDSGTFLKSNGAGYAPGWATADVTIGTTTISLGGSSLSLAGITTITTTGNVTVGNDLTVDGNLTVNGTQTIFNTTNYEVEDSLIYLASTNAADILDIGIVGAYNDGSHRHLGFVRDATDGVWKLFSNCASEPSNSTLNFTSVTYDKLKLGSLYVVNNLIETDTDATVSFQATTSGTSAYTVYSFPVATYRSGEIALQITNNTSYKVMKLMVIHDGSAASVSANYLTDSELQTADTSTTMSATISGGNVLIQATVSTGTAVVKGKATLFKV